ncbi:MAG: glycosyltransferase [Candidatus Krumholzibacteriota bacterium]|nr:glycosyltransferase [Candidatus Krumholzibacteriota bacterium]
MSKPELSIVILNYNTKELLADCLKSIKKHENEVSLEVIVSDNGSDDGSVVMLKNKFPRSHCFHHLLVTGWTVSVRDLP